MSSIDVKDLPARLSEALAEVARGGAVILTDGERPCARLSPVPRGPRIFGLRRGVITYIAPDFDDPLPDSFWMGEE